MTVQLQKHIHLADQLGPSPEYAPIYSWKASLRVPVINFSVEIIEGLTGARFDFAVESAENEPVRYQDFYYELKLREENGLTTQDYVNRLIGLAGKRLYLTDHYHPNNGERHSSSVRLVRMTRPIEFRQKDTLLQYFIVGIYLSDLSPL